MTGALVVNADDLGVSEGATLGIVRAHREGVVTSASLSVTTPFYRHALDACVRTCPDLGIGLHFTLTAGRPISSRVPLLADGDGFLRWRFLPLLRAASLRQRADLLAQVELELEAQLRRIIDDGVRPDHIDGERHVHLIPGIFERVAAAAARHGIPYVRVGRDVGAGFVRLREAPGLIVRGGFAKSWLLSVLSNRDRRRLGGGVRSAEHFASYLYSGRVDMLLTKILRGRPTRGVTEVMVHPGLPEQSRNVTLGNRNLERYVASEDRRRELEACIAARRSLGAWSLTSFTRLAGAREPG